MRAHGIDVSKWQGTTPNLTGLDFLFARASIGTLTDETYDRHIAKAKAAGLLTGAYHFGDEGSTPAAQAKTFLAKAGDVDFYFLDHEGTRRMGSAAAKDFIRRVRDVKGRCGLYASLSGFPSFGQDYNWIALWAGSAPPIPWAFWQYQGSPLDKDVFNGTLAELRAFAAGKEADVTPAPITDPTSKEVRIPAGASIFDVDGKTILRTSQGSPEWRPSPYEQGNKRAIFSPDPPIVLIAVADTDIRDVPTADCTAAIADATAPLKETIESLKLTVAGEPQRIASAIAADRAKAQVGIVYP